MMRDIYIFGAGGFAKEVFFLIHDINGAERKYNFAGFIDMKPASSSMSIGELQCPILDEETFFNSPAAKESSFALGMGNTKVLNKINQRYVPGYDFPNLVHPSFSGYRATIAMGKGNVVTAGCIFTLDIKIGNLNLFNMHTTLGHDSVIGDCNVFNPGVNLSGGIEIGDRNLFGTNCSVLQYVKIGSDNSIGAGAMVNRDIGNFKISVGVPAKVIVIKDKN